MSIFLAYQWYCRALQPHSRRRGKEPRRRQHLFFLVIKRKRKVYHFVQLLIISSIVFFFRLLLCVNTKIADVKTRFFSYIEKKAPSSVWLIIKFQSQHIFSTHWSASPVYRQHKERDSTMSNNMWISTCNTGRRIIKNSFQLKTHAGYSTTHLTKVYFRIQ